MPRRFAPRGVRGLGLCGQLQRRAFRSSPFPKNGSTALRRRPRRAEPRACHKGRCRGDGRRGSSERAARPSPRSRRRIPAPSHRTGRLLGCGRGRHRGGSSRAQASQACRRPPHVRCLEGMGAARPSCPARPGAGIHPWAPPRSRGLAAAHGIPPMMPPPPRGAPLALMLKCTLSCGSACCAASC